MPGAEPARRASAVHAELDPRQLALMTHALKVPFVRDTVQSHKMSHGVSDETARSDLLKLVAHGLLLQTKAGKAHVFVPVEQLRAMLSEGAGRSREGG